MKKIFVGLLVLLGCTLEVPVDEIEIPAVENNTRIVITLPDGLSFGMPINKPTDVQDPEEIVCEFQQMPDYENNGGHLVYCTGVVNYDDDDKTCCTWGFLEPTQMCEEEWCLSLSDKCGWKMISWACHRY